MVDNSCFVVIVDILGLHMPATHPTCPCLPHFCPTCACYLPACLPIPFSSFCGTFFPCPACQPWTFPWDLPPPLLPCLPYFTPLCITWDHHCLPPNTCPTPLPHASGYLPTFGPCACGPYRRSSCAPPSQHCSYPHPMVPVVTLYTCFPCLCPVGSCICPMPGQDHLHHTFPHFILFVALCIPGPTARFATALHPSFCTCVPCPVHCAFYLDLCWITTL